MSVFSNDIFLIFWGGGGGGGREEGGGGGGGGGLMHAIGVDVQQHKSCLGRI